MIEMQVIFDAIKSAFDGNATLKASVTGLYLAEAPPKAIYPYITYHLISDVSKWDLTSAMEDIRIQFSIFDDSPSVSTINTIFENLKTCYDDCKQSVSPYYTIKMWRELSRLIKLSPERVWHYVVDYSLLISE